MLPRRPVMSRILPRALVAPQAKEAIDVLGEYDVRRTTYINRCARPPNFIGTLGSYVRVARWVGPNLLDQDLQLRKVHQIHIGITVEVERVSAILEQGFVARS